MFFSRSKYNIYVGERRFVFAYKFDFNREYVKRILIESYFQRNNLLRLISIFVFTIKTYNIILSTTLFNSILSFNVEPGLPQLSGYVVIKINKR